MKTFSYATTTDTAAALEAIADQGTWVIAGGTELVNWMKEGIAAPARLVDIRGLPLGGIHADAAGLRLGALARMSDVAAHPVVTVDYPVLAESLLRAASPQLRNMATLGGNLMQRTRCPYFRAEIELPCNKRRPGSGCAARHGETRWHAIFGWSEHCVATHPSDLAVALAALDAVIRVQGARGERAIPVAEFHRLPGDEPERDTVLRSDELIVAIDVPVGVHTRRSHYLKIRERVSYEFAVVSAAAAVTLDGGTITGARLALGGVAARPWRLPEAEAALRGVALADLDRLRAAVATSFEDARPLAGNAFKVELAQRTAVRALRTRGEVMTGLLRPDGPAKLTGAAVYAADTQIEHIAHALLVPAVVPTGRIAEIDTGAASAQPGVLTVLTHRDLPRLQSVPSPPLGQSVIPLSDDRVYYEGQPVAMVLAETPEQARHAAGLAEADAVITATYTTADRHHNPMEPSATVAMWDGDQLTVHDATQWISGVQQALAAAFDMPTDQVRVVCPFIGGGFGCKGWTWPHQLLTAAAARVLGRPVKLVLTRAEMFTACGHQPATRQSVWLGARRDERLTAIRHHSVNSTARFHDFAENATGGTRWMYASPAIAVSTRVERTDHPMPTPMRAPAEGVGMFALESAMDELAHELDTTHWSCGCATSRSSTR